MLDGLIVLDVVSWTGKTFGGPVGTMIYMSIYEIHK